MPRSRVTRRLLCKAPAPCAAGASDEAEQWLDLAERHSARRPRSDGADCRDASVVLAATGSARCCRTPGRRWRPLSETSDWRGLALIVYAAAHALLGDNDRANELFGDAITHARRTGFSETQVVATGERMLLSEEARDHAVSDKQARELTQLLASGMLDVSVPTCGCLCGGRAFSAPPRQLGQTHAHC